MSLLAKIRDFLPIASIQGANANSFPPALTIGLMVFLPSVYIISRFTNLNDSIALSSKDLLALDLNRLSFYPLGHLSVFHLLFNCVSLLAPLSKFERKNGTVITGVVLNLITVIAGLIYSVLKFNSPVSILGASGWVFTLMSYFAYKESLISPVYQITPTTKFPTLLTPFIPLVLIAVLVPGSSFVGHLAAIVTGYILALGYLKILLPPSRIIQWIEVKLEKLINLIPSQFKYYKEIDAKYTRDEEYVSFMSTGLATSASGTAAAEADPAATNFQGDGHVLGV